MVQLIKSVASLSDGRLKTMSEQWLSEPISALLSLFVLSFAAGSVLPLGSEWYFAWLLSEQHNPTGLWWAATTGNTLGGILTWWLGKAGRARYEKSHALPAGWETATRLFRRFGIWSLLLSWVPVVGDILVLMAGISQTPRRLSWLLIFIGKGLRYGVLAGILGVIL